MDTAVKIRLDEVARYMRAGTTELDGELRLRTLALLKEAPVEARSVWKLADEKLYLCGTIGSKFDAWQRRLSVKSGVDALIAQAIGAAAVEAVMDEVESEAKAAVGGEWEERKSPGYGAMPLSESVKIIEILEATKKIGVATTVDHLLLPAKSVTAICRRK